ncbi:MAG: translocation/assembly module TamB domain-containing protein [Microcoleaceae cyanobacterium]
MTHLPNGNPESDAPRPRGRWPWKSLLLWGGVAVGMGGIAIGLTAVWFVKTRLAPTISGALSTVAQRPVEVGPLEWITPTQVRFGESALPPTESDPSYATTKAVEVSFSLISLLFQPKVKLDITLVEPDVYLEETSQGQWLDLELKLKKDPPVQVEIGTVRIEDAAVDLNPYDPQGSGELIALNLDRVRADLSEKNQRIQGDATGKFEQGGTFAVKAQGNLEEGNLTASLRARDLQVSQFDGLVKSHELTLKQGEVDANLAVELVNQKFSGVQGTVEIDEVQIDLKSLEQPLRPLEGNFKFSGTEVEIKNLTTGLGDAAIEVAGTIATNPNFDFEQTQFDLTVNLPPTPLATVFKTIETELDQLLKLPVPIAGEAEVKLNLTGSLPKPKVQGNITNTQPIQVDRLTFETVSTNFESTVELGQDFVLKSDPEIVVENLKIEPSLGGIITGSGKAKLNGLQALSTPRKNQSRPANPQVKVGNNQKTEFNPQLEFSLAVNDLPVDQIAQAYGVPMNSPLGDFRLGELLATAQVSGTVNNPKIQSKFALPAGSYPISGTANLVNNQATVGVQIADGAVNLVATQNQNIWNANVNAEQVALTPLVNLGLPLLNVPDIQKAKIAQIDLTDGQLNLQANVSGSLKNLKSNNITGTGNIQVSLGGRLINANTEVNQGQFQANFNTDPLPLPRLVVAGLPFANLSSNVTNQIQNLDVSNGSLQAQGNVAGNLTDLSSTTVTGNIISQVDLGNTGGQIKAAATLDQGQFKATVDTTSIPLNPLVDLGLPYANLSPQLATTIQDFDLQNGRVQGQGLVEGSLTNLNNLNGAVQGSADLGNFGGSLQAQGSLNQGQFQARVNTSALPLEPLVGLGLSLATVPPDLAAEIQALDLRNGTLQGQVVASGSLRNLTPTGITANGDGAVDLGNGGGWVKATGNTTGGQWNTVVSGDEIALNRFSQLVESQITDLLNPLRDRGLLAQAEDMPLLRGFLNTRLSAAGAGFQFNPQTVQAAGRLNLSELPILKQPLESVFNWNGQRVEIEQAETPQFGANGILAVEFQGTGVPKLSNLNLNVRVSDFDLNSPLVQQMLATLPSEVTAGGAPVTGMVNFKGKLTGAPATLALAGNLQLDDLAVRDLNFDPVMAGTLTAGLQQGVDLALAGDSDRIELELNDRYLPVSFLVQAGEVMAQGVPKGDNLLVTFSQFPLDVLNLAPLDQRNIGEISGIVSGTAEISELATLNLEQIGVVGQIAIHQPTLGYIMAERLDADVRYEDGIATLDGVLRLPNSDCVRSQRPVQAETCAIAPENRSLFLINGRADVTQLLAELRGGGVNVQQSVPGAVATESLIEPPIDPGTEKIQAPQPLEVTVKIKNGELQDMLTVLQWFELGDVSRGIQTPVYGTAAEVQAFAVGLPPDATLTQQLQRLAEIRALLDQQTEQQMENPLPSLSALRGGFEGEITATGSIRSGINGKAKINNTNIWTWGEFTAEEFTLEAVLEENVFRVIPLQLRAGGALYDFRGQLDLISQRPSGQFRVKDLRLEKLQESLARYTNLTNIDVTGELNFDAKIAGTLENPQATGVVTVIDGTFNQEPLQEAQGSFTYNNARLSFGGNILLTETDPIRIKGNIPYRLPFAKVAASGDQIQVQLDVQDEGLKVINLISPINLVEGKGLVQLKIGGVLRQNANGDIEELRLQPQGVFKIQSGKLILACEASTTDPKSQVENCMEQSIVGLTGTAEFLGDRLRVAGIQGELQGETGTGKILLQGILPMYQPFSETDPDALTPLQLSLDNLNINLEKLYTGNVAGIIQVTGTALEPEIGGLVAVSNGTVILPGGGGGGNGEGALPSLGPIEPSLNNLRLALGDNIRIRSSSPVSGFLDAPLLDFSANGTIVVNGELDSVESIQPQGVITLTGGAVNLYTSRLRLDRGYPQRAIFVPSQGLDPVLDVRLVTRVPESTLFEAPVSAFSSERLESTSPSRFGTVRTIRVTAIVQGPASRINDIIELKSSPSRSKTQLLALLGGSAIEGVTGDSTLFLANLASVGLFSDLQQKVIRATGLTEFRLYPARVAETSQGSSALGIGLEIGFDVTDNFSVSLSRVLATEQPTQLGVNYRVNDELLLRGATNFSNETEIRFEYEIQF